MSTYDATLKSKRDVAQGTTFFSFSRPKGFEFKSGQAIDLILPDGNGPVTDSDRHAFSIVSAPFQDELCVTTRMRDSAYKRRLKALGIGGAVKIDGPFGSLTLHNKASRAGVLIAGGIGITPFMSILSYAAHEKLSHRLLLIYSNRRPEDTAFLPELHKFEQQNPHFTLLATMTEMVKSAQPWTGETSFVDADMIKRATRDLSDPIFYLVGPPAMVEAMKGVLDHAGVDEDDIRTEEFYGY